MTIPQSQTSIGVKGTHGPHFALPPTSQSPSDLRTLQQQIERITQQAKDKHAATQAFLALSKSLTNAIDVAHVTRQTEQISFLDRSPLLEAEQFRELLLHWSATACVDGSVQLNQFSGRPETIVTLPVYAAGSSSEAINAALLVPKGKIEPFVVSLQLVATAFSHWATRNRELEEAFTTQATAAILELVAKCQSAENIQTVAFTIVNEMQALTGCEAVALALYPPGESRATITALSGTGVIDQRSEVVRHLTEAANETIDRGQLTAWPPRMNQDQHAVRLHQQLGKHSPYRSVLSCPLETTENIIGSWLFLGDPVISHDQHRQLTQAASGPVASAIALRKAADEGPLRRLQRSLRGTRESRRMRWKLLAATIIAAAILCIHVPHKISCDCVVKPTVRRFATVPFNGILQDSLVRPGDIVTAQQTIARMDCRDLRLEKSEATKTKSANEKEYDRQRADEQIAEAQIARLRAAEAGARLELIQHHIDHAEIRSPISGVVLQGDLDDVQGASVQRGQTLFEIAPLDSLKLKLFIPEADIGFANTAMSVTARLDGASGKKFEANLSLIHPRANADSGKNSFAADATFAGSKADELSLRPGMRGTAKIIGPDRSLGWIVFHRAYRKAVDIIDW